MLKVGNWIGELTTTVGAGTITLGGALPGFAGFSVLGEGNTVWYAIVDGDNRESGIGTYSGGTLARTTPHASLTNGVYADNGVSPISLSGSANVYCTFNATAFAEFEDKMSSTGAEMTGVLALSDGTESLPAISFVTETSTGFSLAAAGDLRLSLSGTSIMRWNAGVVSVWDTAWKPLAFAEDILDWALLGAEQTFTESQSFVNGLVVDVESAWVEEDIGLNFGNRTAKDDFATCYYNSASDSLDLDFVGASDAFNITSEGSIGFTFVPSTGTLTATGNLLAYSDKRLKSNLSPILSPLSKCSALRGWSYDRTDIEIRQDGLIAQDVLRVLPNSIFEDADGMLSVSYNGVVALLVNCVNELTRKVEALETK